MLVPKTTVGLGPVWPPWKWECNHIENENDGLRLSLPATSKWSNPAPITELFDSVGINSNPPSLKWLPGHPVRDDTALSAPQHRVSDASSIKSIQTVSLRICLVSTKSFNQRVTEKCWYKRHKSRMIWSTKGAHTHASGLFPLTDGAKVLWLSFAEGVFHYSSALSENCTNGVGFTLESHSDHMSFY